MFFSVTKYAINKKKSVHFSEQMIINCDSEGAVCRGSRIQTPYDFMKKNGIILMRITLIWPEKENAKWLNVYFSARSVQWIN